MVTSRRPDSASGSAHGGPADPGPHDVGVDDAGPRRPGPERRRPGAHRAPRSARQIALAVLVLLVAAGAAAALLVARPWAGSDDDADADRSDTARVATDIADWVDGQLAVDTPVLAPADVRAALSGSGAADRFTGSAVEDALVVVRGEPRDGALVLARFAAADGSTLSIVDPAPGQPTGGELDRRRSLAAAVLANPVAGVTGPAADVLRDGRIDARLLGVLAALVSRMDVHVADLPPAPAEPADAPPARWLLVDRARGERLAPGAPATDEVVAFLEAQRPPFAPDTVEVTDEGLLVGFHYVSAPDAVVSAATR
jgi:hypothetical protein